MSQIIQTVLDEANKNNLVKISKIVLEVGELSFLGENALQFCFQALAKENILRETELIINTIKPEVECLSCGYIGNLGYLNKEEYHFMIPQFTCPKCKGDVKIIHGKGCIIKEITGEMKD